MNNTIQTIPLLNLAIAFFPVILVVLILQLWSCGSRTAIYAMLRMVLQLLAVGYVLTYIFETEQAMLVVAVLLMMIFVSSWIALRPVKNRNSALYFKALIAIVLGGCTTLGLVTQFVLELKPWFLPHYMIPLAGMIFANSMNAVSLAAERFDSELVNGVELDIARTNALQASLIPSINMLFAVGLVSLPGMMTGQILSGVSPLIAVRYQVMVMCMLFGSSGISAAIFLMLRSRGKLVESSSLN